MRVSAYRSRAAARWRQVATAVAGPPSGIGQDAFQVCAQWRGASAEVEAGGLTTGITIVPVPLWATPALATAEVPLDELTGGGFILGVGSGSIHAAAYCGASVCPTGHRWR